jgi:hypothetical protein
MLVKQPCKYIMVLTKKQDQKTIKKEKDAAKPHLFK